MDNYNKMPEGMVEIPQEEFMTILFQYCLRPMESRQVFKPKHYNIRMWEVPNFDDNEIGILIADDWFDEENQKNRPYRRIYRFFIYGGVERWKKFRGKFAAQFAGDNS